MSVLLTDRGATLRDQPDPIPPRPVCTSCRFLLVGMRLWRCENCLRYTTGQRTQPTQPSLFEDA
jgi:ribosomal protein L37AE/L43A